MALPDSPILKEAAVSDESSISKISLAKQDVPTMNLLLALVLSSVDLYELAKTS